MSDYFKWLGCLVFVMLVFGCFAVGASAPAVVASVVFMEGGVEVVRVVDAELVQAYLDMPLHEGDLIETREGGRVELEFSIGDVVRLAGLSKLEIVVAGKASGKSKTTFLSMIRGKLLSKVDKVPGSDRSFSVQTPVAVAAVKGTVFQVSHDEEGGLSEVQVLEGTIEVMGQAGEPVVVEANQKVDFEAGLEPSEPVEISATDKSLLQTWKTRQNERKSEVSDPVGTRMKRALVDNVNTDVEEGEDLGAEEDLSGEEAVSDDASGGIVSLGIPQVVGLEFEIEEGVLRLGWDVENEENLDGFTLYREGQELRVFGSGELEFVEAVLDLPGVVPGKTFEYVVKAKDSTGKEEMEGKLIAVKIPDEPPAIESMFLNRISVESIKGGEITLQRDDLVDGALQISGFTSYESMPISKVEVSLDGGQSWKSTEGTDPWRFQFTPVSGQEYEIQARAINTLGIQSESSLLDQVVMTYQPESNQTILTKLFKDIIQMYEDEDAQGVLDEVSSDFYGGKDRLQNDLEQAFESWSNISITVSNLVIDIANSQATITFGWVKSVTEHGLNYQEQGNSQLVFIKEDSWKWLSLSGDRLFRLADVLEEHGGEMPWHPW